MAKYCSECGSGLGSKAAKTTSKPKASRSKSRKPSAYSAKYAKAFKSVSKKNKKKSGGWKKGGYARSVKQAHAKAKRMR